MVRGEEVARATEASMPAVKGGRQANTHQEEASRMLGNSVWDNLQPKLPTHFITQRTPGGLKASQLPVAAVLKCHSLSG